MPTLCPPPAVNSSSQASFIPNHDVIPNSVSVPSSARALRSREIWPQNPRWWRIEWCDEEGTPIGLITFER